MTRKNKILFILSVFIILAPIAVGLILWERLFITVGSVGRATVYITVFIPFLFLLLHLLCVGTMLRDYHKNGQSEKIVTVSICLIPAITVFASVLIYATLLTGTFMPYSIFYVLLGVLFILLGNYMPKAKRNHYFGIKVHWTLASDDVWMRTHRFGGKVSITVGALLILCVLLPQNPAILVVALLVSALASCFIPTIYAFVLYKKMLERGEISPENAKRSKKDKMSRAIAIPLTVIILAVCAVLCFTGSITFTVGENALVVDPTYWSTEEISYEDIEAVELIAADNASRVSGFGTPVLSMGLFRSEAHGNHTRYAYSGAEELILLTLKDGGRVILADETVEKTYALYQSLIEKIS